MSRSAAVDGFSLVYDRHGAGPTVVLLHGWPGMRTDHRALVPLLDGFDVVVPDVRGFGESDKHVADPAEHLIDGKPDAVRVYLRHIWDHWGGPGLTATDQDLDALAEHYTSPGAFVASINWYRAGSGGVAMSLAETTPAPCDRIAQPTRVLWPEHDPLFPREWSDRIGEFFADFTITDMPGAGHFSPLEAPTAFAEAISASTRA